MTQISMKEKELRKGEKRQETKQRHEEERNLAALRSPTLEAEKSHTLKRDYESVHRLRMQRIHANYEYGNEKRLDRIVQEVRHRIRICKKEIYEIGCLLVEAKVIIGHGPFQQWIRDTFDFSYETAVNFMNVYKACLAVPALVTTMKASVLYQIAAPGFPADLRECIFEHRDVVFDYLDFQPKRLEDIRNEDVKELLRRYKAGELDLESDGVKQFFENNKKIVQYEYLYDQIELCLRALEKSKHNISSVGGFFKIAGYDSGISQGQDPEVGQKISEICNTIGEFITKLTRLMGDIDKD